MSGDTLIGSYTVKEAYEGKRHPSTSIKTITLNFVFRDNDWVTVKGNTALLNSFLDLSLQ